MTGQGWDSSNRPVGRVVGASVTPIPETELYQDEGYSETAGPGSNGEPGYVPDRETPNRAARRAQARTDRLAARGDKRARALMLAERERDRRAAEAMFARSR